MLLGNDELGVVDALEQNCKAANAWELARVRQGVSDGTYDAHPRVLLLFLLLLPILLRLALRGHDRAPCARRRGDGQVLEQAERREGVDDDGRCGLRGEVQAEDAQCGRPRGEQVMQRGERAGVGGDDGVEAREASTRAGDAVEEAEVRAAEACTGEDDGLEVRAAAWLQSGGVDGEVRDVFVDTVGGRGLAGDADLEAAQPRPGGSGAQEVGRAQDAHGVACVCVPHRQRRQRLASLEGIEERRAQGRRVVAVLQLDMHDVRAQSQDRHDVVHARRILPRNPPLQPQRPHQLRQPVIRLQRLPKLPHKHLPAARPAPRVVVHRKVRNRPILLRQRIDVRVVEVREAAERAAERDGAVETAFDERLPGATYAGEGRERELGEVDGGGDGLLDVVEDVVEDLGWEAIDIVHCCGASLSNLKLVVSTALSLVLLWPTPAIFVRTFKFLSAVQL